MRSDRQRLLLGREEKTYTICGKIPQVVHHFKGLSEKSGKPVFYKDGKIVKLK